MRQPVKAWWFSSDKVLPHGDGRQIRIGTTHKVTGEIIPCRNGLHASRRAIDALSYNSGPHVWRMELSGSIVDGGDKLAASERKYIAGADATETLDKFARMCALDVIHLWEAPDIVVRFLKTGDETSRDAARYAAWAAAWDTWDTAGAAWAAAWAATRDAARAAAEAAQNRHLTRMLNTLLRDAKS